jgi:hypothetical protein
MRLLHGIFQSGVMIAGVQSGSGSVKTLVAERDKIGNLVIATIFSLPGGWPFLFPLEDANEIVPLRG